MEALLPSDTEKLLQLTRPADWFNEIISRHRRRRITLKQGTNRKIAMRVFAKKLPFQFAGEAAHGVSELIYSQGEANCEIAFIA
jgi:hypothetical protein